MNKSIIVAATLVLAATASLAQAAPATAADVIQLEKVVVVGHRADLARAPIRLESVTVVAHRSDERLAQSQLVRATAPLIAGHHGSI